MILLLLSFFVIPVHCEISVSPLQENPQVTATQDVTAHPSATVSSSSTFAKFTYAPVPSQSIVDSTPRDSIPATPSLTSSPISTTPFPTDTKSMSPTPTRSAAPSSSTTGSPPTHVPRCDQPTSSTCTQSEIKEGYQVRPQSFKGPKEVHRPKSALRFRFRLQVRKWENSNSYLRIVLKRNKMVTVRRYYVVVGSGDMNRDFFWEEWQKAPRWVTNNSNRRSIKINVPLGNVRKGFSSQCCDRILTVIIRMNACKNGVCSNEFITSKRNTLPCEVRRQCK